MKELNRAVVRLISVQKEIRTLRREENELKDLIEKLYEEKVKMKTANGTTIDELEEV